MMRVATGVPAQLLAPCVVLAGDGNRFDGTIEPDGTGKLYATGLTNSKEFIAGRAGERGTGYRYNIDAHFRALRETGMRVDGHPCSYESVRQ